MTGKPTFAICLILSLAGATFSMAQDDVVFKAMRDELARSMKKLQLDELEKPYFIAYKITETNGIHAAASFGSLTGRYETHARTLAVELRVGDYKFDNKNFFSYSFGGNGVVRSSSMVPLPLDDDYDELRRQIWLATDGAYKKALEDIAKKRAALTNRTMTEDVPDFSHEKAFTGSDLLPAINMTRPEAEKMVRDLSALFRQLPDVFVSNVRFDVTNSYIRFVNTEGSSYAIRRPDASLTASASTQAPDGQQLADFFEVHARSRSELPSTAELSARIKTLSDRLAKLRTAGLADRYSGPVLFEGDAAAELFSEKFARHLVGTPKTVVDNRQFESMFGADDESLQEKAGARVLPEFLTVVDDPTMTTLGKEPLIGAYKVDDDAVPVRKTVVIENGYLKSILTSRAPVLGFIQSSGSNHGGSAAPSNLIVTSTKTLGAVELRAELLRIAKQRGKDYGIVVRKLGSTAPGASNGMMMSGPTGRPGARTRLMLAAYKLYLDGREELIRNATINGLDVATFKEIVAVSDMPTVYTTSFMPTTRNPFEPWSPVAVTYVVPSLLFEEVSLQKSTDNFPKPPFSGHPFFSK